VGSNPSISSLSSRGVVSAVVLMMVADVVIVVVVVVLMKMKIYLVACYRVIACARFSLNALSLRTRLSLL